MLLTWNSHHVKFISNINARQYMVKPTQRLSNMTERQTGTQREKNMILNCQCLEIKRIVNMMIIHINPQK